MQAHSPQVTTAQCPRPFAVPPSALPRPTPLTMSTSSTVHAAAAAFVAGWSCGWDCIWLCISSSAHMARIWQPHVSSIALMAGTDGSCPACMCVCMCVCVCVVAAVCDAGAVCSYLRVSTRVDMCACSKAVCAWPCMRLTKDDEQGGVRLYNVQRAGQGCVSCTEQGVSDYTCRARWCTHDCKIKEQDKCVFAM